MSYYDDEDRGLLEVSPDGEYRVKLVRDTFPSEPEDDGAAPMLRLTRNRYYNTTAEAVKGGDEYAEAYNRFDEAGLSADTFRRWLRIFHGTTSVYSFGPNNYTDYEYLSFDTDEWVERVGVPAENRDTSAGMNEWIEYLEGEVFFLSLEQKTPGACGHDGCQQHISWETADTIGGFYGDNEYTRTAHREHFQPFFGLTA